MPDVPQIDPHRPDRQSWDPISPTDAELDVIDAFAGACRVTPVELRVEAERTTSGAVVLVSDLTAEIRRHRQAARVNPTVPLTEARAAVARERQLVEETNSSGVPIMAVRPK